MKSCPRLINVFYKHMCMSVLGEITKQLGTNALPLAHIATSGAASAGAHLGQNFELYQ